jgi:predicted nuclease of predicted toxin-antitoxin system
LVGAPPRILFVNVGNISNNDLKKLIEEKFSTILELFLTTTQPLIEISTS